MKLVQCNSPRNILHLAVSPGDVYLFHSCIRVKLSIVNSNYTYDSNATMIGCSEKSKKSQIVIRATESVIIEKVLAPFEISVRSNASLTKVEQLKTKELFSLKAPGVIQMLNLNLENQILYFGSKKCYFLQFIYRGVNIHHQGDSK